MKTKVVLFSIFYVLFIYSLHGQSNNKSKEYQRFRISVHAGLDWPVGSSNTILTTPLLPEGFTLPFASPGLGAGFDGAYFFTKNYGIGVKYHFYTANEKKETGYMDETYRNNLKLSFREKNHFVGPAVFGRWYLFNSKWEATANLGVLYVYHKLLEIDRDFARRPPTDFENQQPSSPEDAEHIGWSDFNTTGIGFTASAGICYRITPVLGAGLSLNGFFASLSNLKYDGNSSDISRKMNRIGVSAEISVSF